MSIIDLVDRDFPPGQDEVRDMAGQRTWYDENHSLCWILGIRVIRPK